MKKSLVPKEKWMIVVNRKWKANKEQNFHAFDSFFSCRYSILLPSPCCVYQPADFRLHGKRAPLRLKICLWPGNSYLELKKKKEIFKLFEAFCLIGKNLNWNFLQFPENPLIHMWHNHPGSRIGNFWKFIKNFPRNVGKGFLFFLDINFQFYTLPCPTSKIKATIIKNFTKGIISGCI